MIARVIVTIILLAAFVAAAVWLYLDVLSGDYAHLSQSSPRPPSGLVAKGPRWSASGHRGPAPYDWRKEDEYAVDL